MNQFKKAQVIMLPTNNISPLYIFNGTNKKGSLKYFNSKIRNLRVKQNQHLYITSDDEIKEGDYYYSLKSKIIYQKGVGEENFYKGFTDFCKKIIATTDTSLIEQSKLMRECFPSTIGQLSQQFIENYIKRFNIGQFIHNVLVEYEVLGNGYPKGIKEYNSSLKLKINPKDNTIIIKDFQNIFNRDQVTDILKSFCNDMDILVSVDAWFKQNY